MRGSQGQFEELENFVAERYRPGRKAEEFRNHEDAPAVVREFYRLNHENQTLEFVRSKHAEYDGLNRESAPMWDELERLNELVDDNDPDTFPAGCAWPPAIVSHEFFRNNPDARRPELQTETGIYERGCGLANVYMSWGHDEYLYQALRDSKLPREGLAMLRYHSFYPWRREGAYRCLMNDEDKHPLPWVQLFSQYDLYSKSDKLPDVVELRPYYQSPIDKYLPAKIHW